jgi:hypothetical protein
MKKVLPVKKVEEAGFAKFNGGPHLCVDVPDGHYTISVKTSEGRKITFAFCPYKKDGPAQCVDIQQHDTGKAAENGSPVQKVICFTPGNNTFRSGWADEKPTTLVTVLLKPDPEF